MHSVCCTIDPLCGDDANDAERDSAGVESGEGVACSACL